MFEYLKRKQPSGCNARAPYGVCQPEIAALPKDYMILGLNSPQSPPDLKGYLFLPALPRTPRV